MPTAIIFPANPEALVYDLAEQARKGAQDGLKLYTNGRQFALLPKPARGWALWGGRARA